METEEFSGKDSVPSKRRSLSERVNEELSDAARSRNRTAGFEDVTLGGATYTKMLGKRVQ